MSATKEDVNRQAIFKQALAEMKSLRARLEASERARSEPIAVLGMACRFAEADDPEAFWQLLSAGIDATSEVPKDRWDDSAWYSPDPDAPGKTYARRAGFVRGIERFDARLFNISPREAASIDPQHRLFWELAWEALERAGHAPGGLSGSRTGVFVGITGSDYARRLLSQSEPAELDGYVLTGSLASCAAGRLSYMLGLQGPSVAIDTACSSSLVAVHLACQSLRSGEVDLAIVGGVSLMLSPEINVVLSKARALAPDGRSKTFDRAANGYGRGEGCGVVVLARQSDGRAMRAPVLAVLLGSAVNQDGPSSGPTVPSGLAQQALVRQALANAGIKPAEISYVEAHGTGTQLGDPIELRALGAVLREGRPANRPFLVGSAKPNIGHTEAAAGMAGLIKVVLALRHGQIPPQLHFREPNPNIPWSELPARVPSELTAWGADGQRRIAGVSSFGISGTNAHVVVSEPPPIEPAPAELERPAHLLALSARDPSALVALSSRYEEYLAEPAKTPLADICYTAGVGRSHHNHRLAVVAASRAEARARLAAFAAGEAAPGVSSGRVRAESAPKIAFLFTGQGSQYVGMGRSLYQSQPIFRAALDRCDELLRPHLDRPLLSLLYPPEGQDGAPLLDETAYTQPALFALQHGLTELWRSFGVEPCAALGHSVGELSAACAAGVFSLEQGLQLIAERGRLMQSLPRDGRMVALFAEEERVAEVLRPWSDQVSIAAINGPTETVISGACDAVQAVTQKLANEGVKARELLVSHAFHSPLMAPILDELERAAARVTYAPSRFKLIANLTGRPASPEDLASPAYYRRHAREPVRFAEGIRSLHAQGIDLFVEIGPRPTLLSMGRRCLPADAGTWLPSLRDGRGDWLSMLDSVGALYIQGASIDWRGVEGGEARRLVSLPTYPFQGERHWIEPSSADDAAPRRAAATSRVDAPERHPLVGRRVPSPVTVAYEAQIDPAALPIFRDHRIFGRNVLSGVVHLAMARAAAAEEFGALAEVAIHDVVFHQALVVDEGKPRTVQMILRRSEAGDVAFQLFGREPERESAEPGWILHTSGTLRPAPPELSTRTLEDDLPARILERCRDEVPGNVFYDTHWKDAEHFVGPSFRLVQRVFKGDGEVLAELRAPALAQGPHAEILDEACLLEAAAQTFKAALPHQASSDTSRGIYVGIGIERFVQRRGLHEGRLCHVRLRPGAGSGSLHADVRVLDERGDVVGSLTVSYWQTDAEALRRSVEGRSTTESNGKVTPLVQAIRAADRTERRGRIEAYLVLQSSTLFSMASAEIDPEASLRDLGLDSLRAMDLRAWIERDLSVVVPAVDLLQGPSPRRLSEFIDRALSGDGRAAGDPLDSSASERGPFAESDATPALSDERDNHARPSTNPTLLWFRRRARSTEASVRLFCFPFGGGTDSVYRTWGDLLPETIEVCAVKLPGREDRMNETPFDSLPPLLDALEQAVEPLLDRPFAFFGTSMGAILGFELARRIRSSRGLSPAHLFVAASPAPHLTRVVADRLGDGSDIERSALRLGVIPETLLGDAEMTRALLPALSADFRLMRTYAFRETGAPLDVPITVYGGERDALVPRDALANWSTYTRRDFVLRMLPGEHLFVRTDARALLESVAQTLGAAKE